MCCKSSWKTWDVSSKNQTVRYLANKCSLASRIDCFSDEATTVFGEKLKDQAGWWLLVIHCGSSDPLFQALKSEPTELQWYGERYWGWWAEKIWQLWFYHRGTWSSEGAELPIFFGCQMHRSINLQYTLSCIVDFLGDQVEERLTFLSEGTTPRKNLEVMQEAIKEAWHSPRKNPWTLLLGGWTWWNLPFFLVQLWCFITCDSTRPKDVGLNIRSGGVVRSCVGKRTHLSTLLVSKIFQHVILLYCIFHHSLRWLSGWDMMDSHFRDLNFSRLSFTVTTTSTTGRWPSNERRRQRRLQPRRLPPRLVRPLRKEPQNLQRKRSADLRIFKGHHHCSWFIAVQQHTFWGSKISNRRKVVAWKVCWAGMDPH